MKCVVLLTWDDGIWFSTTKTDSGERRNNEWYKNIKDIFNQMER